MTVILMFMRHIRVSVILLVCTLLIACSPKENLHKTVNKEMSDDTIQVPITIQVACNESYEEYDYDQRLISKTMLKENENPPYMRGEYFEIIHRDGIEYLSGFLNLLTIQDGTFNYVNLDDLAEEQRLPIQCGISPRTIEAINQEVYFVLDLGLNEKYGESYAICTSKFCKVIDEGVLGAGVVTKNIDNQLHTMFHIMTLEDGYSTFFGSQLLHVVYNEQLEIIYRQILDLGFEVIGLYDFFIYDSCHYYLVFDEEHTYLIEFKDGNMKTICFDILEYWGPTKEEGQELKNGIFIAFLGKDVVKIDLEKFEIISKTSLNEIDSRPLYSQIIDDFLYIIDDEELFVYTLNDASLVQRGKHGINNVTTATYRIVAN